MMTTEARRTQQQHAVRGRPRGRAVLGLLQNAAVALVVGLVCCAPRARAELKTQLTLMGPFEKHDHKGTRIIPYFEKTGSTNIMQSFVRVSLSCVRIIRVCIIPVFFKPELLRFVSGQSLGLLVCWSVMVMVMVAVCVSAVARVCSLADGLLGMSYDTAAVVAAVMYACTSYYTCTYEYCITMVSVICEKYSSTLRSIRSITCQIIEY